MNLHDDIKFIRNGMNVRRYHQHPTLEIDTVGKHSCGVALLVNLIDPHAAKDVILAALCHDLGEWVLGDIPAPTKRMLSDAAKVEIDSIEDDALIAHGLRYPLASWERRLLKICDCLDGLSFCIEETNRGNLSMAPVRDKYLDYLNNYLSNNTYGDPWFDRANEVFTAIVKGA